MINRISQRQQTDNVSIGRNKNESNIHISKFICSDKLFLFNSGYKYYKADEKVDFPFLRFQFGNKKHHLKKVCLPSTQMN